MRILRRFMHGLCGEDADFTPLLEMIGGAHFVLLGEATHGTHEFYHARAQITRQLIERHGFNAVAVEADWPDAYRVNRYVRGMGKDTTAMEALGDFARFPRWMWRNAEVMEFVGWLREHNEGLLRHERVGLYGLDLYSLHRSMDAVIEYLEKVDAEAAARARQRYGCFEHFGDDPQAYGYTAGLGVGETCEDQVVAQLAELRRSAMEYLSRDGMAAEDELFAAEQNARLARDAERYYREMFRGRESSWNMRDRHMGQTLWALQEHLRRQRGEARVVVWAHNSHLGDARATSMSQRGEINLGQLVRESRGDDAMLVGFTTDHGTVSAASDWGAPVERKRMRHGRADSYEGLFHEVGEACFMLNLRDDEAVRGVCAERRLERAIGVIYLPESELASHYFRADLSGQFDAVVHYDQTRAVEPLDRTTLWERGDLPETYPGGL